MNSSIKSLIIAGSLEGRINSLMKASRRFIQVCIVPGASDLSQILASPVNITGSILSNTVSRHIWNIEVVYNNQHFIDVPKSIFMVFLGK